MKGSGEVTQKDRKGIFEWQGSIQYLVANWVIVRKVFCLTPRKPDLGYAGRKIRIKQRMEFSEAARKAKSPSGLRQPLARK